MTSTQKNINQKLHCIFRVDASTDIGIGHVMRCLTLATSLKKKSHQVTFFCRELEGNLIAHIKQSGFNVVSLKQTSNSCNSDKEVSHAQWLQTSWELDATECISALQNIDPIDWVIVDHYALDTKWESKLKQHCINIMAIDDIADRKHNANIILDQNLYPDMESRYSGLLSSNCITLLGPNHTLLREEFTELRNEVVIRKSLNNLLVFFGGVDTYKFTLKTISAIKRIDTNAVVNIIIGSTNPNKLEIIDACKSASNIHCHTNITDMAKFMLQADLAIGAGGTTTWERCYLGLPAIVVTLAENQAAVNQAVAKQGACIIAGGTDTTESVISSHLQQIISHPNLLTKMSLASQSIMENHLGVDSIITILETSHA